jgi:23S rRNA (adenine2030-N6)-methyltransferase
LFRRDRRAHCYAEDGYRFSVGLLPPAERRGLILMDPSYELRGEYDTAMTTLGKLYRRFRTGTYALWYPILDGQRTAKLRQAIREMAIRDVLGLEISVAERELQSGMVGCGMLVINPPWTLHEDMELALPYLASILARDGNGSWRVAQWADQNGDIPD